MNRIGLPCPSRVSSPVYLGEDLVSPTQRAVYGEEMDVQKSILMCASCWRIQPLTNELCVELDQWIDPTTFMACGQVASEAYDIIDGYCDPCLMEMAVRDQLALARASAERTNA